MAAASWYGGWYGGWHKHKSAHKSHEPKTADRAGKEPAIEIPKGPQQIFISINQQKLYFYSNGVHVADTSIATGVAAHPTPYGVFSIIQKQVFHRSNIYSNAPMPFMQRITWSGVAMHEGPNIGHPASHGCIRMPRDFAVRLYHLTKLNTRVIIARAELKPVEFADPHLFVHKERPPEIAAPVANDLEPVVAKPAELVVHANTLTPPVQSDVVTPQAAAPAVEIRSEAGKRRAQRECKCGRRCCAAGAAHANRLGESRGGQEKSDLDFRQPQAATPLHPPGFRAVFDVPVTITEPESPLGAHVFTALEFAGPEHTILRWNVVSLPGEPPKRVRYVEERRDRHGRVRRREIEEERAATRHRRKHRRRCSPASRFRPR